MEEIQPKPSQPGFTEALGSAASNPSTPRSSGEDLWALDRWWKVSSCENRIKAQFEQYVRRGAKESIKDATAEGDLEEASQLRSSYQLDLSAGEYSWQDSMKMGKAVRKSLIGIAGTSHLLYLLLRRCHPEITETIAFDIYQKHIADVVEAIKWSLGNSSSPSASQSKGMNQMTKPVQTIDN